MTTWSPPGSGGRGLGAERDLRQRPGGERGHPHRHRPVLLRQAGRRAVRQPERRGGHRRRRVPARRRDVLVPAGAPGVQRRPAVHRGQHGGRAPVAGGRHRGAAAVLELLRRGGGDDGAAGRRVLAEEQRGRDAPEPAFQLHVLIESCNLEGFHFSSRKKKATLCYVLYSMYVYSLDFETEEHGLTRYDFNIKV